MSGLRRRTAGLLLVSWLSVREDDVPKHRMVMRSKPLQAIIVGASHSGQVSRDQPHEPDSKDKKQVLRVLSVLKKTIIGLYIILIFAFSLGLQVT